MENSDTPQELEVPDVPRVPDVPSTTTEAANQATPQIPSDIVGMMGSMPGMPGLAGMFGAMMGGKKTKAIDDEIHILVGTPAFNSLMYSPHSISIKNLETQCHERDIQIDHAYAYNESLITRGRNTICEMFMKNKKYTHLLFIDADIEFEAEDIFKMLEYDKPVVGGIYPKKTILWDKVAEFVNKNHKSRVTMDDVKKVSRDYAFIPIDDNNTLDDEFAEVRYTGTGILLIQRNVLEKMQEAYPNDTYISDNVSYFRFFDVGLKHISYIKNNIYLSEDFWFCERWRELGGKIYLYTKMRCKHWGSFAY